MSEGFSALLQKQEKLYALLEPNGSLSVHWGESSPNGSSLLFRKFHAPLEKAPSAWKDFSASGAWAFQQANFFSPAEIERATVAAPKAAPLSDRESWNTLCRKIEAELARSSLQKAVPARQISFPLTSAEYQAILAAIPSRLFSSSLENAFRFVVKSGESVFFGVTPELLFRREHGKILVPAIAGTRALAGGVSESVLGNGLLDSAKDRAEHEMVVRGIREALLSLGLAPESPNAPSVLRVPRLLHLYTPISAVDNAAISSEALMEALHPTPAVGGLPRRAAASFLRENEGWDRGLFAAPLLFRAPERELCLVAIRSALLTPDQLYFFAGAGYVKGSTPQSEWEETERKLQVMRAILFGDQNGRA